MKFRTTDNVELDYSDSGGDGQAVLLLNGIGSYKEIWLKQVEFLKSLGYRVIKLDARNQGQSQRTLKGRRISKHAQDIKELLDFLNINRFVGIGNSMGAATLFAFISLYGSRQLVSLMDIDQSPKMVSDANWKFGFKSLDWDNFPAYLKIPFGPAAYHDIDDEVFAAMKKAQRSKTYDAELNYPMLVDHAFQDWRDVVSMMNVPLLIIAGEKSPYFDPKFAKVTAGIAKDGDYQIIKNCGHLVMAEKVDEFNQILKEFLN